MHLLRILVIWKALTSINIESLSNIKDKSSNCLESAITFGGQKYPLGFYIGNET